MLGWGVKTGSVPKVVLFQNYRKLDVDLLSDILSDGITWNDIFSFLNVDDCVHCFTLALQGLLDFLFLYVGFVFVMVVVIPGLLLLVSYLIDILQDRLHHKALHTGCSEDWLRFRQSRNKYTSLLRSAKRAYVLHLATNVTTQSLNFWKYVGRFTKRKGFDNPMLESSITADDLMPIFYLSIAQSQYLPVQR